MVVAFCSHHLIAIPQCSRSGLKSRLFDPEMRAKIMRPPSLSEVNNNIELLHQPIVKCSISLLWEQMQPAHTCTETVTSHIFFSRDGFYYYAITSKRNHVTNFDSTCFLKWYWMIHDKIRRGLNKLTSLPTKPWSHILGGEHCTSMNQGHGFELHWSPIYLDDRSFFTSRKENIWWIF